MDRPKRKTILPAKLLESEQIVNKKKVPKLAKNQLKDIMSKETEVDLSKEKEVDNFSMNLVPSSQFEHDTNPDRYLIVRK